MNRTPHSLQVKDGKEAAHRAKRGVRQGVVQRAEVVACTLSSAGGDLLSLVKGPGCSPSMLFNTIMIDEVWLKVAGLGFRAKI